MPYGIFDGRKTELVFNDYLPSVVSPWVALERVAEQMAQSASSRMESMQRVPGIGIQLRSYMYDPGDVAYLTAAAAGRMGVAEGATVAPHFFEENAFTRLNLTGVGYASGVAATGNPMIGAKVPAGTDYSTIRLSSDQTAFPSPFPSDDQVSMDRVYKSPGGVLPGDVLLFNFQAPASVLGTRATIATVLFRSAPGVDQAGADNASLEGTGWYGMKVRGDGRAFVFEKLVNNDWTFRYSFLWSTEPTAVVDGVVGITVASRVWQDAAGNYLGDTITFAPTTLVSSNFVDTVVRFASDVATKNLRNQARQNPVYTIPRVKKKGLPSGTDATVQIDLARDCRALFSVLKHVYRHTGYVLDDYFGLEQPVTPEQAFYVYVEGVVPSGTSLALEMDDQDGIALSTASSLATYNTASGQTVSQAFTPRNRMRGLRVKITATSNGSNTRTPTIVKYGVYRSPIYTSQNPVELVTVPRQEAPPALPCTTVDSVTITPQEADPGAENATFTVWDLTGELAFLGERNMVPVLCRTEQNEEGPEGTYADLFRGYVLTATGERMRNSEDRTYPSPLWTRWTLQCAGEWARTAETLVPRNKAWLSDPTTGQQWRVTDVIRFHAELTYPPSMVDVPDIDVPLLTDDPNAYLQEVNTRTIDAMQEFSRDYLGAYLLFDEAAGDKGMLRLRLQRTAPYNNLAIFEMKHPTDLAVDSVPRLPHWAGSYEPTFSGDQRIKHTFIRAGTYNHWLEKAEGNCVVVYGSAIGEDANRAGASDGALLMQRAVNVGSYNFLGLSPSEAGYPAGASPEFYNRIVPIKVVDWKLGSQRAVDWKCRRVYEKACFARFFLSFDAPMLLVMDSTDPLQVRPRRLRYYDPVQVRQPDGSLRQYLVISCVPTYRKDHTQMARYVLVTQSNIDTIGAIDRKGSTLQQFLKAFGRATGSNWLHGPPTGSQQKQGEHLNTQLMGLPTPLSLPIQDYDPGSATFGQFINMAEYEAIPTITV